MYDKQYLFPTLHVEYERVLSNASKNSNNDRRAYKVQECAATSSVTQQRFISYSHKVVEIKFPLELKEKASEFMRHQTYMPKDTLNI